MPFGDPRRGGVGIPMASVRKMKPRMVPRYPTNGRIHILVQSVGERDVVIMKEDWREREEPVMTKSLTNSTLEAIP